MGSVMKKKIINNNGTGYISTAVYILFVGVLFAAVLGLAETVTMLRGIKEDSKTVLDCCVLENAKIIYSSIKQGHSGTDEIQGLNFSDRFVEMTGCTKKGSEISCVGSQGEVLFVISDPEVSFEAEGVLRLKVSFEVTIPLKIGDFDVLELKVPVSVKSRYINIVSEQAIPQ